MSFPNQPQVPSILNQGKYIRLNNIGGGKFGQVFRGQNVLNHRYVAIKVEPNTEVSILYHEVQMLQYLSQKKPAEIHLPSIKWYGVEGAFNFAVMDLYGPSLEQIAPTCRDNWSICQAYLFQILRILQYIHIKRIVHRDIKPANFLTIPGKGKIVLIDFGMSKIYWDFNSEPQHHITPTKTTQMIGTPKFMSLFVHECWEPLRRDDLISAVFTILSLWSDLPWDGAKNIQEVITLKRQWDSAVSAAMVAEEGGERPPQSSIKKPPTELIKKYSVWKNMGPTDDPLYLL